MRKIKKKLTKLIEKAPKPLKCGQIRTKPFKNTRKYVMVWYGHGYGTTTISINNLSKEILIVKKSMENRRVAFWKNMKSRVCVWQCFCLITLELVKVCWIYSLFSYLLKKCCKSNNPFGKRKI